MILKESAIVTPFGDEKNSVNSFLLSEKAVVSTTLFGVECSVATFKDDSLRDVKKIASLFSQDIEFSKYNSEKTLFIFSVAKGDIRALECEARGEKNNFPSPNLSIQGEQFKNILGLNKSVFLVVSNACAAGATAIDTAKDYLELGNYETVIVAGYEFISEFTISGFNALSAISSTGARPFDENRNGMSLGEGGGVAVFSYQLPQKGDVVLVGTGASNDANHRTGPSRTGEGLAAAINSALINGSVKVSDIGAVKCHGTATPYNDAMEAKALTRVFGEKHPPSVSTKGAIGHLSGAGSLIESILAVRFLQKREIPPTINFVKTNLEDNISISNQKQSINENAILSLAAGFGGLNTALIFKEEV